MQNYNELSSSFLSTMQSTKNLSEKTVTAYQSDLSDFCRFIDKGEIDKETILYTIQSGITTFLSGGQGYFDEVCATIVYQLKTTYPHIKNILMIPYHSFRIFDKSIFDEIVYPFDSYESSYLTYRNAIPERNRVMVMRSRIAISNVYRNGGASKTLELARANGLEIIDLFSLSLKNEIKLKHATLQ